MEASFFQDDAEQIRREQRLMVRDHSSIFQNEPRHSGGDDSSAQPLAIQGKWRDVDSRLSIRRSTRPRRREKHADTRFGRTAAVMKIIV
jgi:hypothetical protein